MTDTTTAEAETVVDTTKTETVADTTTQTSGDTSKATDTAKTTEATTETTKEETKSPWGDTWREDMAGGDDDLAKEIARYGSPRSVAKALKEAKATIRSGKLVRDKPDASDEKGLAEWRKEQGIPDDPSGYKLPEAVQKRLTDEDKPILSDFTEFAHKKGARPDVVEIASEWYINAMETIQAKQAEADTTASEAAEDALRKDWVGAEYKSNLTLGKRFLESIPGVGDKWAEARLPNGRRLGDIPDFISWASDQGRSKFGDVAFTTSDGERKHTARREEIEKIIGTDEYYEKGLDKEYAAILEKDLARKK
jgi:hypothetical protein